MAYKWSWVGKFGRVLGKKFDVVRRKEAEEAIRAATNRRKENPVWVRLLKDIEQAGGQYLIRYENLNPPEGAKDKTVTTTAVLKLKGIYYVGIARESRHKLFAKGLARLVALGRAYKAATTGWDIEVDGATVHTTQLSDVAGRRVAGRVEPVELQEHYRFKEDRCGQ